MFGRVIYVCDANMAPIASVTALDDAYTSFKLRVVADKALAELVPDEDENNGYAGHKDEVWEELAYSLGGMCGSLRSYAKKNKNFELLTQAKFSPTAFLKKRGSDAIPLANSKLTLLTTHVASLANYNVTPAKITAAKALSDELALLNPKSTAQRSVDKANRSLLTKQVKETTALLKDEIDPLVRSLQADYPGFVEQYFNARRIVKTGVHHEQSEEELAALKAAAEARKLKKEAEAAKKKAKAEAAKKLAATPQPEEGNPTADGGQPDTNGSQPPTESPNHGETSGEMA